MNNAVEAIKVYSDLHDALVNSTRENNRFQKAVLAINWATTYEDEYGDQHFELFEDGSVTLVCNGLDPFAMEYAPIFELRDGGVSFVEI